MVTLINHAFSCSSLSKETDKDILQKHGLKYVLCIGVVFQMYCTDPPDSIGIPFDSPDRLLVRFV